MSSPQFVSKYDDSDYALDKVDSPWQICSYQLISWWDMEKFSAGYFYQIARLLELYASDRNRHNRNELLDDNERQRSLRHMRDVEETCTKMGLIFSAKYARDLGVEFASNEPMTWGRRGECIGIFQDRIQDEMDLSLFMHIPQERAKYYKTARELFGNEVVESLPECVGDIEEAGKCLATSRNTGAVFHLMRIMERGLQKFGSKLRIKLPEEKVWQNILDEINKIIRSMNSKTLKRKGKQAIYAETASHLYNVKLAWRNPVMHPKASYTDEEAEDVFTHVKAFTRHLVINILK